MSLILHTGRGSQQTGPRCSLYRPDQGAVFRDWTNLKRTDQGAVFTDQSKEQLLRLDYEKKQELCKI